MRQTPAIVFLYTDGACLGNPGPGGWGAILQWQDKVKELSAGQASTTNNQMELMAVINGLSALKRPVRVHIVTDSRYVMNGIQDWLPKWKLNNWRTATKKPVANKNLWEQLDSLCQMHEISWEWVKGHSGHPMNERCDALASMEAAKLADS